MLNVQESTWISFDWVCFILRGYRPSSPYCPHNPADACGTLQALAEREAKIKQEVAEIKKTYYCEVSSGGLRWGGLVPALAAFNTCSNGQQLFASTTLSCTRCLPL